jgi:hypothetical protein|tara:strand:- start:563 stop:838 length:276 start_codon:yes stop_codon:yes gene_type:complete
MSIWKPITTEAALGTNTGAASNVGKSRYVRLLNTAAEGTEYLVTLEQSDGTDIGTFSIEGLSECIIQKDPTDQLFAANAAVLAVGVAINSN